MIVQIDKMSSKQVAELFEDGSDLSHKQYQTLTDDRGYTSPKLEILP